MFNLKAKKSLLAFVTAIVLAITGCTATHKQESTGQLIDSSAITTKVKAELLADPDVKSLPIKVKTYKSTVQLSGFVDSMQQKQRAVAIASNVPGVRSVQDSLVVKRH